MKYSSVATIVVRGSALAMFIVGFRSIFELVYIYLSPEYTGRLSEPGALKYSLVTIAFSLLVSFILFILSGHLGHLLSRDLDPKEPNKTSEPTAITPPPAATSQAPLARL
jgi:hypothetical protein